MPNIKKEHINEEDQRFHKLLIEESQLDGTILNNPFFHTPSELGKLAAEKLKNWLIDHPWNHDFGNNELKSNLALGKMFGVLVVKNSHGETGYLQAFSGKIDDANTSPGFVPPIYDVLKKDGFFKAGEDELNQINKTISELEKDSDFVHDNILKKKLLEKQALSLSLLKFEIKQRKDERDLKRLTNLSSEELRILENESKRDHFLLKDLKRKTTEEITELHDRLSHKQAIIDNLRLERKLKSAQLQQKIFESFKFINENSEEQNLFSIFESQPPSGAGECCGPRLFQYAFQRGYKPLAIAEFWWGQSPPKEIRKHGQFYPACRSKCKPILEHMLSRTQIENNPITEVIHIEPTVMYEDNSIIIINKPPNYLSVPGKVELPSVKSWVQNRFTDVSGPLIVHRLDMATSGLMIIAKNLNAYIVLQKQFKDKTINKRYIALLDGKLDNANGEIELPLRVDLDDRPRQLVCFEHGKPSLTKWELIKLEDNYSRVYFYPLTGRTHQLRVHSSHASGLNRPIKGDDLYGKPSDRLYLHANRIQFIHPKTRKNMIFECEATF